jgi:hypothetical protein
MSAQQVASTGLFGYIECFYNRQRVHSTLGYVSSVPSEANYLHSLVTWLLFLLSIYPLNRSKPTIEHKIHKGKDS